MASRVPGSSVNQQNANKRIPPDFSKKWGVADVILVSNNAENLLLHVNRAVMATFSPVFEAVFFSNFEEVLFPAHCNMLVKKNKEKVKLDIEYDLLKEILQIVHSIDRQYGVSNNKIYSASMLFKLYRAGDKYDMSIIRDLCIQQFQQINAREAFEVALKLELHDQKSEILKRMTFEQIEEFLQKKSDDLILSPNDVAEIVNKCKEHIRKEVRCKQCKGIDVKLQNSSSCVQKSYFCNKCRTHFYL